MTKKAAIIILFSVVTVVALYASVLYFTAPLPIQKNFATYSEAITGNPQEDHWLPDFLPESARNIHVEYGLDPTFQLLEFSFSPGDEKIMTENFIKISANDSKSALAKLARRNWHTIIPNGADIYSPRVAHNDYHEVYLVIDTENNKAWYSLD